MSSTQSAQAPLALRLHPQDDVAVALVALSRGQGIPVDGCQIDVAEDIPAGQRLRCEPSPITRRLARRA